jgi:tRNA (cmo5U34)-methyltransferase
MIVALVPHLDRPFTVVELCCGEGLLAEALLERSPTCTVIGLDGSAGMLQRAQERLAAYEARFQARQFDLAETSWRETAQAVQAVVTSMAVHHLDGPQKQALFRDVYRMVTDGGAFVIADIIQTAHSLGQGLAAKAWDEAVRERSLELDGNTAAFDFFTREGWNTHRYLDPDDIDKPSRLFDQLKWLEQAGFADVDVHWMRAGHAVFGGRKLGNKGES